MKSGNRMCRSTALIAAAGIAMAISGAVSHAARTAKPAGLTASQILIRTTQAYNGCKTYRDTGTVSTAFYASGTAAGSLPQFTTNLSFFTAFVRPNGFRFEYNAREHGLRNRYIVWQKAKSVKTWWSIQPGVQNQPSLSLAIAGATGVSGGSAYNIPVLLLPDLGMGSLINRLPEAKRMTDSKLGSTVCYRIQGRDIAGRATVLWIDKAAFLVRRLDTEVQLPQNIAKSTTLYAPVMNGPIAPKLLAFNPPSK